MISTLGWVPRGAAKRVPVKQELNRDEVIALKGKAALEVATAKGLIADDDSDDDAGAAGKKPTAAEIMADPAFASLRDVKLPKKLAGMVADADGEEDDDAVAVDPLAERTDGPDIDDEDDDGSDAEDFVAKASDTFLLAGNTEEDYSSLEVYCYNTSDGSLFVHHDIALPAFPLALAWMDYAGDGAAATMIAQSAELQAAGVTPDTFVGSYVAVGTFKSDIEIWNLDVIDPLEPSLVLKGSSKAVDKKGKKAAAAALAGAAGAASAGAARAASSAAAAKALRGGHTDAVMGLAWNRTHRHMLASGSADTTVKLWSLDSGGRMLHTFAHHKGKVQSLAWNPTEATILATASFDRTIAVFDAQDAADAHIARYALPADVESMQWNVHNPACLVAACEDGQVVQYDCRMPDKPLWTLKAHGAAVTGVSMSPLAPGLMATSSLDKSVRIWDCNTLSATTGAPTLIASKTMSIGQVFSVSFYPHSAFLLAAGGSKGVVAVWDLTMDAGEIAPGAPAPSADDMASPALPAEATLTSRRFASRLLDPAALPALAIRPRVDAQPTGEEGGAAAGAAAGAAVEV